MARDPYSVLGVTKGADQAAIRAAYRKLAKKYHPDRNQGDQAAEDKFKAASSAFEILGDKDKKTKFDRGEIDADGNQRGAFAGGGVHWPSSWRSASSEWWLWARAKRAWL